MAERAGRATAYAATKPVSQRTPCSDSRQEPNHSDDSVSILSRETKKGGPMNRVFRTASIVVAQLLTIPLVLPSISAAPKFSEWSAPVNLGPVVNSPFLDAGATISKDGLSLYFSSDRPGGFGGNDIWVSQRASRESAWGLPINLGEALNTAAVEGIPTLSRDGHWLFFNSNRSGGFGLNDIWASYREHTKDDFGWQAPFNLGAGVNTPPGPGRWLLRE
jgi:hypothetical protein